ncbi:MAG: hypothetical protein JWM16_5880 [Verrucomicrobiales bacterium]|nr:hypothetical protein [Verrucomicrobiales bacterium]
MTAEKVNGAMKYIFAPLFWLALVLGFCACSATRETKPDYAATIRGIYEQDRAAYTNFLGAKAALRPEEYAAAVRGYTARLRTLAFTNTPAAFEVAYLKHIQSWEAVAFHVQSRGAKGALAPLIEMKMVNLNRTTALTAAAKTVAEWDKSILETDPNILNARQEVQKTWNEIELVAMQNGVRFK